MSFWRQEYQSSMADKAIDKRNCGQHCIANNHNTASCKNQTFTEQKTMHQFQSDPVEQAIQSQSMNTSR